MYTGNKITIISNLYLDNDRLVTMHNESWDIDKYIISEMVAEAKQKQLKRETMTNNTKVLHEAGLKRREEQFATIRIARKMSNELAGMKMERFYQNTILLLSGFKPMPVIN